MSADRVRVAFIGAGAIARQRHLPGLRKIEGVELVAVANRHRASAEAVARDYQIPVVKDDWREIVEMPDVDAVFVATPPLLHRDATIAALQAGKHVFCQARMARTYAEALEMYRASRETPLRTMLCPPPHSMGADYFVKKLLEDGLVGAPRDVHVYAPMGNYADPAAPLHWRQDFEVSGYNTQFLGMYTEVMHRWLGYHRAVSARVRVHTPRRPRPGSGEMAEVKIADSLAIATEMENGALSSWHLTGVSRHPQPHRIEIHGSDGTLIVNRADAESPELLGGRVGEPLRPLGIPADRYRHWRAEADFVDAIRLGTPVSPDFTEGLKYMEFTEAVYRSAQQGREVRLPLEG